MPTSVLWVTLIAVWLFVLIPMVLRGRPQARKTTAAAANTRLVHRGGSSRTAASRTATRTRAAQRAAANADERAAERRRKAAEAKAVAADDDVDSDEAIEVDAELVDQDVADDADVTGDQTEDVLDAEYETEDADADADEIAAEGRAAEDIEVADESGEDDVDVVSAAELTDQIPVVPDDVVDLDQAQAARDADQIVDDEYTEDDSDVEYADDEYEDDEYEDEEYEDESASVADDEVEDAPTPRELRGRGGYGPDRLVERETMQYRERQRMVVGFSVVTLGAIISAFFFQPWGIAFACGMVAAFGTYLAMLRRTVRAENVRRAQRAARRRRQEQEDARLESRQAEPTYVEPPARLRRPGGAILLEFDDEDPAFDHLPTYDFADRAGYDEQYDGERTETYGRAAV
ncbi:divisome protein SepX/GlpR [Gordonia hydrophobica]|uniref:Transmembrane protein n=1 Tax=Gordonia hydrophobica TaxID=40516 RepID=A0ABZ2U368_9ACTN|nr:gephyrin-like molybdotransferase receptor GlpR [Gordonia hydrophobica]MBM7367344.1 type II secretory pathway pseudopilin PulG [Gordonia hydrophobica]